MSETKKALVLGATGGIGGAAATALLRHGWQVTALARACRQSGQPGDPLANVKWVQGDAMNAVDVRAAAEGVQAIVHAANPPGYGNWARTVLPMIDNSIAAAKAFDARLVLPGTIYNFGPDAFRHLIETAPQHPTTEKGRIRVELERRMETASHEGTRALIVRFGDFFGPVPGNNWFSQGLVTPGKRLRSVTYPGRKGVGHAWAYLPDAGETIARLLDRADGLEPFARFHFGGLWDADGTAMPQAIAEALDRPAIKVWAMPWVMLGLAGLLQETPREIYKMRYLWRETIRLNNSKLVAFLGEEPQTLLPEAVSATLKALNVE